MHAVLAETAGPAKDSRAALAVANMGVS
jgi:hypothetical protein